MTVNILLVNINLSFTWVINLFLSFLLNLFTNLVECANL